MSSPFVKTCLQRVNSIISTENSSEVTLCPFLCVCGSRFGSSQAARTHIVFVPLSQPFWLEIADLTCSSVAAVSSREPLPPSPFMW